MRDRKDRKRDGIARRDALKAIGSIPAALTATPLRAGPLEHVHPGQTQKGAAYAPKFFTEHEWKTANLLADMILPRDDRSGSASEAGALEYVDEYAVFRGEDLQTELRGGLLWLDRECGRRFEKNFVDCTDEQRSQVLDLIAYPEKTSPGYSQGTAFFTRFRDLAAGGFYTSKVGIADLGYQGNRPFDWQGCPGEVLERLGLKER